MNKVILMGRLTRDPNVRYTQQNSSQESMCVARYTLAVDRRGARDGQQSADFISYVAFGKNGEFAEKYFKQGTKIAITGRIQTGSYTNRDGQKIYTTDVVIEEQEFAESKKAAGEQEQNAGYTDAGDGFMNIPDGVDEQLPFCVNGKEERDNMGIMSIVKNVIEHFRKAGKTENEISGMIEQTADRATVNKGVTEKKEYKRPEIKVETSAEQFVEAVMQTGVTAEQVKTAIMKMCDSQRCTNRQNTNNWRKMHGLPMRRKQKARKKHERGKRADSH